MQSLRHPGHRRSALRAVSLLVALIAIVVVASGCATAPRSPYQSASPIRRDTAKAQELTQRAADLIDDGKPEKAEELLRKALAADLYHGPAHNNLGVIHLERGDLYEAANEFEWARKVMPGHPDPRLNLAITLESAGRIDEALVTYDAALEVYSNHLPTMQALARCQLRYGHADERTRGMLEQISLRGETSAWREWSRERLLVLELDEAEEGER